MRRSAYLALLIAAGSPAVLYGAPAARAWQERPERPAAETQAVEPQRWRAVLTLPDGTSLDLLIALTPTAEGVTGTMDVPAQGFFGGRLDDLVVTPRAISFTLRPEGAPESAAARVEAAIDAEGSTGSGTFTQGGLSMPLLLVRLGGDEEAGPARPQEPRPPFPYESREVTFDNDADGATLAGTLTVPEGAGPHPAVLLITGSGPQDRDEAIAGHKPFLVIADHLTRRGVAVLRVDDRGVGGSTGPIEEVTTEDFARDALAGVRFLAAQPEVDAAKIGLVGHSEGALVAPLVANASDQVAFIALLASPGVPGGELLIQQTGALLRASGVPPEEVEVQLEWSRRAYGRIAAGAERDEVRQIIHEIAERQLAEGVAEGALSPPEAEAMRGRLDAIVDQQTDQLTSAWFRYFVAHDPRGPLRRVRVPVLAMGGELDLQVPPDANLPEVEAALRAGGNDRVTIRVFPGLNHLFQTAQTGSVGEYAAIEETFAPAALEALSDWIRGVAGID